MAAREDVGVVSDAELIQRTGAGDQTAFEMLYRRHARPVFGLAMRRLGDSGRAEDAVQDTFASVWRSARTYRPERGVGSAWLYTVARNAIVDCGRARRRAVGRRAARPALARARPRRARREDVDAVAGAPGDRSSCPNGSAP